MKKIQKSYQFTLILKNVDRNTPGLEDSLYEAGVNDALINFRNDTVYLDFDRTAASLEEAVIAAIKNVESSSIGAVVGNIAPDNWVTESEAAKRLDMKRQTISLWIRGERRKSALFPKPVMKLSDKSPLWKWSDITKWLYQNKLLDEKEIVENASFLENMNAVLEDRDTKTRKIRRELLKKLDNPAY